MQNLLYITNNVTPNLNIIHISKLHYTHRSYFHGITANYYRAMKARVCDIYSVYESTEHAYRCLLFSYLNWKTTQQLHTPLTVLVFSSSSNLDNTLSSPTLVAKLTLVHHSQQILMTIGSLRK